MQSIKNFSKKTIQARRLFFLIKIFKSNFFVCIIVIILVGPSGVVVVVVVGSRVVIVIVVVGCGVIVVVEFVVVDSGVVVYFFIT